MDRDPHELERRIIEAVPDPLKLISAAEIGPLFGRKPLWFKHMRAKLEAEGFPRQAFYGRWYARDVVRFMLLRQHGVTPVKPELPVDLADVYARTDRYLASAARRQGDEH